ncbi:hypothetical protein ACSBR2_040178 [Camellia fascicularis]
MQVLSYDDSFLPRVSVSVDSPNHQQQRRRRRRQNRRASSCCGFPISPIFRFDGLSREISSYDKLPQFPFKLTIHKLDGSSFDVEVAKTATVAELKQAVEAAFSHLPSKGPGKISWSHVWGRFCLCYDGWKLLADSEPISDFGINDGDQLRFVRHVSINYNLTRTRSKYKLFASQQPKILDDSSDDDQENSQQQCEQHYDDRDENIKRRCELKLAQLLGGFFSYRRLGSSSSGRRSKSNNILSSKFAGGFLRSFRSIVRLCRSNKQYSPRDPLEEV